MCSCSVTRKAVSVPQECVDTESGFFTASCCRCRQKLTLFSSKVVRVSPLDICSFVGNVSSDQSANYASDRAIRLQVGGIFLNRARESVLVVGGGDLCDKRRPWRLFDSSWKKSSATSSRCSEENIASRCVDFWKRRAGRWFRRPDQCRWLRTQ